MPIRPGERAPAGPVDNTQALEPVKTGGNERSVSMASDGDGSTAVDGRVDGFVPANAQTSVVPQQSYTGMDLGRLISSALPAAHTVVPGGTVSPRRNTGNREGAGFKGRCFCVKTSGTE